MALSLTPVTATQASATSGVANSTTSFSPGAGSLVVVNVGWMFSSNTAATISVKDSHGNNYTTGPQHQDGFDIGISGIFTFQYATAPGSTTLTVTCTNTGAADALISPTIVTGQASSQAGAATMTHDSGTGSGTTALNNPITTTTAGSFVFFVIDVGGVNAITVVAGSTNLASWLDGASGDSAGSGHTTSATVTPGSVTVGYTVGTATAFAIAALEILPAPPATSAPAHPVARPPGRLSPGALAPLRPAPPYPPTPYTEADPAAASATATAQNPVVTVQPSPAAASATATAQNPSVSASGTASPAAATATAAAQGPVANVIVTPAVAHATATAQNPTATSGTIVTPAAASATATAKSPAVDISPVVTPGTASSTAAAKQPVVNVTVTPAVAQATATAQAPGFHISNTVVPGVAHATAQALSAGFPTPLRHWGVTLTAHGPDAVLTGNQFGGILTLPNYNGTLTPVGPSAQLMEPNYGATLAVPDLGATLVLPDLGAMITGGTMQQASLTLSEFNDMIIDIAVTNNGSPYNLTGQNLSLLLKSAAGTPDGDALVFSSTGGSPAIVINSPSAGLATATLPNTDLDSESYTFYRLDVINASSQQQTTAYGPIIWITL